jgi:thioredoxin 2
MAAILQIVCPHCDQINRMARERLRDGGKCGACHQPLLTGKPVALDDAKRFARHAKYSDLPLLVDVWAPWCGPCLAMAPAFEAAAAELEPEVRLVKVNGDQAADISARFAIRHIPTLLLILHDRELARSSGAMSKQQLLRWAQDHAPRLEAA